MSTLASKPEKVKKPEVCPKPRLEDIKPGDVRYVARHDSVARVTVRRIITTLSFDGITTTVVCYDHSVGREMAEQPDRLFCSPNFAFLDYDERMGKQNG